MHGLSRLTIKNYRSCRDCSVPLADYTPIVGYNNGGKSNLLQAIAWLLDGGALGVTDFFDPELAVEVEGTIRGITPALLGDLGDTHRKKIEPFCADGNLRLRRVQAKPSRSRKDAKLDVFDPTSEDGDGWGHNPTGIDQAISALFPAPVVIGAMQDASEDVAKSKTSTTIGKLIAEITEPIRKSHESTIDAALQEIRSLLQAEGDSRAPELQEFDEAANSVVADFFPGVSISLHLPPPEIGELFKSGTLKVFEPGSTQARDVDALGHGAQRSIQMALIRYLSEVQKKEGSEGRTLLLIDEPELYLHPQAISIVRDALKRLAAGRFQVVFSTHSPQMVGVDDVSDTLIIRKSQERGTHALPTVRAAVESTFSDAKSQANTLFEFSNAAQVLFADRVILGEGKAEQRLLPVVAERLLPGGWLGSGTAIVGVGSCNSIPKALSVLAVMGIPACGLSDLDFAFQGMVVPGDHHTIQSCKKCFESLADGNPIVLGENGLPTRKGEIGTEDAFALMASQDEAKEHIEELCGLMREEGIWVWSQGSLEHHLGISGKDEDTWGDYARALKTGEPEEVIADIEGVRAFFEWATAFGSSA